MTRRFAIAATASAAVVFALPGLAHAKYTAIAGSGSTTVGATTLHNATLFRATCVSGAKGPTNISWTASTDAFVTSYVITRTGNPGASATFTVLAPTTTLTDAYTKNDVFSYTIRAVVQNWTTATSAAPGVVDYSGSGGKCV